MTKQVDGSQDPPIRGWAIRGWAIRAYLDPAGRNSDTHDAALTEPRGAVVGVSGVTAAR
nr:hypothetical protein [Streptomyces antibioticus]